MLQGGGRDGVFYGGSGGFSFLRTSFSRTESQDVDSSKIVAGLESLELMLSQRQEGNGWAWFGVESDDHSYLCKDPQICWSHFTGTQLPRAPSKAPLSVFTSCVNWLKAT